MAMMQNSQSTLNRSQVTGSITGSQAPLKLLNPDAGNLLQVPGSHESLKIVNKSIDVMGSKADTHQSTAHGKDVFSSQDYSVELGNSEAGKDPEQMGGTAVGWVAGKPTNPLQNAAFKLPNSAVGSHRSQVPVTSRAAIGNWKRNQLVERG